MQWSLARLVLLVRLQAAYAPGGDCHGLVRSGAQWVSDLLADGSGPVSETFCSGDRSAWYIDQDLDQEDACKDATDFGDNDCVVLHTTSECHATL